MPINNYIRPQTEIYQQLEVTLDEVGSQMATCVIGPNYNLYRYGKEELPATEFSTAETTIPFVFAQEYPNDYEVDLASVKVFGEGLQAELATFSSKIKVDPKDLTVIRLTGDDGKFFAAPDASKLATELAGYGVQIGDLVAVYADDEEDPRVRTVTDIVGKTIPASVTGEKLTGSGSVSVASTTAYEGSQVTTYLITAVDAKTLKITDTAGIDSASYVTVTSGAVAVGTLGVKATFTSITAGDQFAITCVPATASTTEFDGLRLDAMPCDVSFVKSDTEFTKVILLKQFDGEICSDAGLQAPFTVSDEGVKVAENLALFIEDQKKFDAFRDKVGKLYVQFRVLVIPPDDEEKFTLHNIDEIQNAFGTIDQDNDLAYGSYAALQGAAERAIFAIRTRGTSQEAFLEAVKKSQADRDMYSYAVITEDEECARAVADYNVSLCAPDVKMWRRTIWGVEAIGEYVVATTDNNGQKISATITDITGNSNSTNNTLVQISDSNELDLKNLNFNGLSTTVRKGDYVQLMVNGDRYRIDKVISSKELILEAGPKTEISVAKDIILIHANTPLNRREYVQQVCTRFNSMRKTVVWSDQATLNSKVIKNKYLGAYIAGLASAVVPQQSLTHSEVTLVDNASRTYTLYSREELDDIAKYGCLVVSQDTKGGPCYVRHNLTTETDKGLLYYEESCIRNIDSMSYMTDDTLRGYIGRANVTPTALRMIYNDLLSLYTRLTTDSPSDLLGPQLIRFSDLTVRQDPTLKSRVLVNVKWYVPAPLNNIRVYEMAFVADVEEVSAETYSTEG